MKRLLIASVFSIGVTSGTSFAADAVVDYVPVEPVVAVKYFDGFYIGAHGGWGWADAPANYVNPPASACGPSGSYGCAISLDPEGGFVGVQAGWNYVFDNGFMLGVEGDYSYASLNDSGNGLFTFGGTQQSHVDIDIDQMATIMGRVGFVMDRWMPFATVGWGWVHGERNVNSSFPAGFSASAENWHDGWVLGGGVEYALDEHWTLKGEYRYFDGGDEVYGVGFAGGTNYDLDISTVRFGINYGF
ncbi:outer membrane beta-barrel protein [Mesorhizobium sp. VNQ89]|uniref:outer membrane protein n=1 Tax=Mesorhizobium quangtriensis TaxID=3157709 RepID=UPI0032B81537